VRCMRSIDNIELRRHRDAPGISTGDPGGVAAIGAKSGARSLREARPMQPASVNAPAPEAAGRAEAPPPRLHLLRPMYFTPSGVSFKRLFGGH